MFRKGSAGRPRTSTRSLSGATRPSPRDRAHAGRSHTAKRCHRGRGRRRTAPSHAASARLQGARRTTASSPPPAVAVAGATDESVDGETLLAAASFGVFETPESSLEDALPLLAMLDGGSLGAIGLDGGLGR